jgi:hypothetical protein
VLNCAANLLAIVMLLLSKADPKKSARSPDVQSECHFVRAALEWASLLPSELHDKAAKFFIHRSLIRDALTLPSCSVSLALDACDKFGLQVDLSVFSVRVSAPCHSLGANKSYHQCVL